MSAYRVRIGVWRWHVKGDGALSSQRCKWVGEGSPDSDAPQISPLAGVQATARCPSPRWTVRPYLLLQFPSAALQGLQGIARPPDQHLPGCGSQRKPVVRETRLRGRKVTPSSRARLAAWRLADWTDPAAGPSSSAAAATRRS